MITLAITLYLLGAVAMTAWRLEQCDGPIITAAAAVFWPVVAIAFGGGLVLDVVDALEARIRERSRRED